MESLTFHVGIHVGSTFTDLWAVASDGRSKALKLPTTEEPAAMTVAALLAAADAFGLGPKEFCAAVRRFGHVDGRTWPDEVTPGSGAKVAVITTAGFADTLEIGRAQPGRSEPRGRRPRLVPRRLVAEVPGRVDRTGEVVQALDEEAAKRVIKRLAEDEVEAIAICTLWAAANPVHEERLRELVAEALPDVSVCVSHQVAPVLGEHVRMSTTAVNAAMVPRLRAATESLERALRDVGVAVPALLGTGLGGLEPARSLLDAPVSLLGAGASAAVLAAAALADRMGPRDLLVVDAGGASVDVGLVRHGQPLLGSRRRSTLADVAVPAIDVRSLGPGGGSVAAAGDGTLTVGPRAVGAEPGPACFGRGGDEPTVTDADLLLGTLPPDRFGSVGLALDREAAERVLDQHVAGPLGLDLATAAWGVREVFAGLMADRLRLFLAEHGRGDGPPALVVSGGLGPSHAWLLARELGLSGFVVPATAAVQSAAGIVAAGRRVAAEKAAYVRMAQGAGADADELAGLRVALDEVADRVNAAVDLTAKVELSVTVRYRGRARQLAVPVAGPPDAAAFQELLTAFEREHAARFGPEAAAPELGFEVLGVRAVATAPPEQQPPTPTPGREMHRAGMRRVIFGDPRQPVDTPVHRAEHPPVGHLLEGPCLIELPGCTVVVPPGGRARSDEFGNLHVEVQPARGPERPAVAEVAR